MIHYITTNGIGNAWVAAELRGVQDAGIPCVLHSLRSPRMSFYGSEWAERMDRGTRVIYPLPALPFLVSVLVAPFLFGWRFLSCLGNALFSSRENLRARIAGIAHLFVACHWARGLRDESVSLIHSQWIQSGGTVGWYASRLLGKPFSFTGHAVDLFRDRCALNDKVRDADAIVAISEFHRELYVDEGADDAKIVTVYCGIDVGDFAYRFRGVPRPVQVRSFGRLVEKKGFHTLIEACALLRERGLDLACEIAGSGPELERLRGMVRERALEDVVRLTGQPLLQEEIPAWLDAGHVFAQPCCWSSDNDVDGIPRSLMEAMSVGLPSVATAVAGLPDLVEDGVTGALVPPEDPVALADAIERVAESEELARRLAEGGRRRVEERFDLATCLDPLIALFRRYLGESTTAASGTPASPRLERTVA